MMRNGNSTKELIAALKFRFNYCERRAFVFKGLQKSSQKENPHKIISADTLV